MRTTILALTLLSLTACAGLDRPLRDLDDVGNGPDEFSVTPGLPLELPSDLSLPEPTPGGSNLTDTFPVSDALVALGGRSNLAGGIPSTDAGLVAFVGRNGVSPEIRATVAQEDANYRTRARRFSLNPFRRGDRYFIAYARQALDAYAELERFRAVGVTTPTAPPQ
jgi:hypothetical protein